MPGPAARPERRLRALTRALLLGLVVALLSSCTSLDPAPLPSPAPRPTSQAPGGADVSPDAVALHAITAAILGGDRAAYERQISDRDPGFAATADRIFDNLTELPLSGLTARFSGRQQTLSPQRMTKLGTAARAEQVRLRWRLVGDSGPAEHLLWFTFVGDAGASSRLAGTTDGPAERAAQPLWLLDRVQVERSSTTTVLVSGATPETQWGVRGDAAVAAVRKRLASELGSAWNSHLVLEIPATRAGFERVLGVAPGSYAQIAAVAWPEGPDAATAAVRIIINPDQASRLSQQSVSILLTHEATHVATRSAASAAPTWLVEGFADFVAFDSSRGARAAAAEPLLAAVRRTGAPRALPTDAQFAPDAADLSLRYAESWSACRYLAEQTSPKSLANFYRQVDQGASVDEAAVSVFGFGEAELVRRWRASLITAADRD